MPFELPPLTYAYDGLEPTIDEQTMHLHHDKHHQAYVNNLNAATEGTPFSNMSIDELVRNLNLVPGRQADGRAQQWRWSLQPLHVLGDHGAGWRRRADRA